MLPRRTRDIGKRTALDAAFQGTAIQITVTFYQTASAGVEQVLARAAEVALLFFARLWSNRADEG